MASCLKRCLDFLLEAPIKSLLQPITSWFRGFLGLQHESLFLEPQEYSVHHRVPEILCVTAHPRIVSCMFLFTADLTLGMLSSFGDATINIEQPPLRLRSYPWVAQLFTVETRTHSTFGGWAILDFQTDGCTSCCGSMARWRGSISRFRILAMSLSVMP